MKAGDSVAGECDADSPADDPLRPVCLAARSLRLLGVLFVLIGLVTPVTALRQGYAVTALPPAVIITALTHFVPGVLYHLCAALLLRGAVPGCSRRWAWQWPTSSSSPGTSPPTPRC